jgi:sugar phosphate isomerase/epimerase
MKIGCNTLYPRGLIANGTDLTAPVTRESLDKLQACGYQACEYSHCDHWTTEEAREIGAYARERGLQSWSCHTWAGPTTATDPDEPAQVIRRCVEICAALGGRVVVVHTPLQVGLRFDGRDPAELRPFDLAALRPAQAVAAELGVELALENGRAIEHMEYVLGLVETLGGANVDICVDTGHANMGTLGPARAIRMAGDKLFTTHLHDNFREIDDHLPPGQATIDWRDVFAALNEVGYSRPLMLELSDNARHRPYDQDLELRQGIANVRRYCEDTTQVNTD